MRSVGARSFFIFFFLISFLTQAQSPYDVTKKDYKPSNDLVHDFGQILSASEKRQLERKLIDYNDSTSVQIVVVTFDKLEGYPIEMLANEIGENWGVGQTGKDNGIVIVLGKDDRKVTLRGGYGIQAQMSPTIEKIIIDKEMIPHFKNGDYYQGFNQGINAVQKTLEGKYDAIPKKEKNDDGWVFFLIFLGIIVLFIIISRKSGGDSGGSGGRRGFDLGDIILMNSGRRTWGGGGSWGGSGGGGFGGGGFGGFGGGSFGGGGASGSW